MKLTAAAALIGASFLWGSSFVAPADPPVEPGRTFVLQDGDYRWLPLMVRSVPTAIDCHFEVVSGRPTVHAELLSQDDFVLFRRHRDYETLAETGSLASGGFQRLIETPGRYHLLIRNNEGASPVAVSLDVHTIVNPPPAVISRGLPAGRKLGVIAAGIAVFGVTVLWSGGRLLRAWRMQTANRLR